jgi:hypothetical protein
MPGPATTALLQSTGFRCPNPACRLPLTPSSHHPVALDDAGGTHTALCPRCFTLHAAGVTGLPAVRTWHHLLVSLMAGYGANAPDLLLALHGIGDITVSGEGFLPLAGLYSSGLVEIKKRVYGAATGTGSDTFKLALSAGGTRLVQGWMAGDSALALGPAA